MMKRRFKLDDYEVNICSIVKQMDTLFKYILRKDRIIPAFPDRNPLFHLVCNHQVMNEDV